MEKDNGQGLACFKKLAKLYTSPSSSISLRNLFFQFFKLGCTAFGGPAAHLAIMENTLVKKRAWITHHELLSYSGYAGLIPGPNSTETALLVGYRLRGWVGVLAAGFGFITPAIILSFALGLVYQKYGDIPLLGQVFYGFLPLILAILVLSLVPFFNSQINTWSNFILLLSSLALLALKIPVPLVLIAIALLKALSKYLFWLRRFWIFWITFPCVAIKDIFANTLAVAPEKIFSYFSQVGWMLYGSGYVLFAYLQTDLVDNYHWLTNQQLVDAIAIGQITPGPLFSSVTFIGYILGGFSGALVATAAIFMPAFLLILLFAPFFQYITTLKSVQTLVQGLNIASLSLFLFSIVQMAEPILLNGLQISLCLCFLLLMSYGKIQSGWLFLSIAIFMLIKQSFFL